VTSVSVEDYITKQMSPALGIMYDLGRPSTIQKPRSKRSLIAPNLGHILPSLNLGNKKRYVAEIVTTKARR
jgi:hypothetical protein